MKVALLIGNFSFSSSQMKVQSSSTETRRARRNVRSATVPLLTNLVLSVHTRSSTTVSILASKCSEGIDNYIRYQTRHRTSSIKRRIDH